MNWYEKTFPKHHGPDGKLVDDRPGCWITWLAETDDEEALLYRHKEQMKQKAKMVRAAIFLYEEGSVEARKAHAETDKEVMTADDVAFSAEQSWRELHNKRKTVETAFDAWRTREASRRATAKGV